MGREGRLGDEAARDLHALPERVHRAVAAEEIVEDRRAGGRVGAREREAADAAGPQFADVDQEAVAEQRAGILGVADRGAEEELDVRPVEIRPGADEGAAFAGGGGKEAAAAEHPIEHVDDVARQRPPRQAVGHRRLRLVFERDVEMVLQVLPDARQGMDDGHAVAGELLRIADAESIRSCGETKAPALRITSRAARVPVSPPASQAMPVARRPSIRTRVTRRPEKIVRFGRLRIGSR